MRLDCIVDADAVAVAVCMEIDVVDNVMIQVAAGAVVYVVVVDSVAVESELNDDAYIDIDTEIGYLHVNGEEEW